MRHDFAAWVTLYVYCAQLLVACAPGSRGDAVQTVAHERYALPADFLANYTLASPQEDLVGGGLRGETPFSHSVSADGESQISVPLNTPPGRNGVEPHLSFKYRHRAGYGLLGRMWDLAGLSRIHRCSKTRAFDGAWSEAAGDQLCLDGKRLIPLQAPGAFQSIDGEIRVQVSSASRTYVAQARDGKRTEYGASPGSSAEPDVFLQTATEDGWGNRMEVRYNPDGSPSSIDYTKNGQAALPTRFVDFVYEPSVERHSRATGGEILVQQTRLHAVSIGAPADLGGATSVVRRYVVNYASEGDVVSSVSECVPRQHGARRGSQPPEVCYQPIVFSHAPLKTTFDAAAAVGSAGEFPVILDRRNDPDKKAYFGYETVAARQLESLAVVDVDGDAVPDIVYMKPLTYYQKFPSCSTNQSADVHGLWYWRRGLNAAPWFAPEASLGLGLLMYENAGFPPRSVDVDGDGSRELLVGKTGSCDATRWEDRPLMLAVYETAPGGARVEVGEVFARAVIGDLDGDAFPDVAGIAPQVQTNARLSGPLTVRTNQSLRSRFAFSPAEQILQANPCHSQGSAWSGDVFCGSTPSDWDVNSGTSPDSFGVLMERCDRCAVDNLPRNFPTFFFNGVVRCKADQCPVSAYLFEAVDPNPSNDTRVSTGSRMMLVDIDGNGVNELVFREAVPPYGVISESPSGPWANRLGAIWEGTGLDGGRAPAELSGARMYLAKRLSDGSYVRQSLSEENTRFAPAVTETTRLIDLNGDGLPDWLGSSAHGLLSVKLNLGQGRFGPWLDFDMLTTALDGATPAGDSVDEWLYTQLGDVDGDGRVEVIAPMSNRMLDLVGTTWRERLLPAPRGDGPLLGYDENGLLEYATPQVDVASKSLFVDVDGDGLVDEVGLDGDLSASDVARQPRIVLSLNRTSRAYVTKASQGARSTEINLARVVVPPEACRLPQTCAAPSALSVVAWTRVTDAQHAGVKYDYSFERPHSDVLGLGWLGFEKRTVTSQSEGLRREETYPISLADRVFGTGACATCYFYPGARRPSEVVTWRDSRGGMVSGNGQVLRVAERFLFEDQRGSGADPVISYLREYQMTESAGSVGSAQQTPATFVAVRSRRLTVAKRRGTVTSYQDDAWEGGARADGSPPLAAAVRTVGATTTLYPDDSANWLVGLPHRTTAHSVWPGAASAERVAEFEYEVGKPVLKAVTLEPDSTDVEGPYTSGYKLRTEYRREPTFGALSEVVERGQWRPFDSSVATTRERSTHIAYDTDWTFPRTVRNPLGHVTDFYFVPSTGALAGTSQHIDVSAGATIDGSTVFDTSGRPVRASSSGAPAESLRYFADRVEFDDEATGIRSTYFDVYGRPLRDEWAGWNRMLVKRSYGYDERGRLTSLSLPYKTRPEYVGYTYDALGRIVRQTSATGAWTVWDYAPSPSSAEGRAWKTTVSELSGAVHEVFTDATGAQTKMRELLSESVGAGHPVWAEQRRTYGAFGLLASVTDAASRTVSFTYDKLGRPTRVVDPDSGTRETRYNAFGEVVRVESPLEAIEYKSDLLSRLVRRRTTPVVGPSKEATFVWDAGPNAIGQIVSSLSEDQVGHSYEYNALGLPASETWTIGADSYSTGMRYDRFSRLEHLTYPAVGSTTPPSQIKYVYAPDGTVQRVEDEGANSTRVFWSALERNAAGQVLSSLSGVGLGELSSGNGLSKFTYDNTGRLIYQSTTDLQTRKVLALAYEYDVRGRGVKARHDRSEPGNFVTEEFGHDAAGRLTDWYVYQGAAGNACRVGTHKRFGYSPTGNLEVETFVDSADNPISSPEAPVLNAYEVSGGGPSALGSRTQGAAVASYSYDAVGNQTGESVAASFERETAFNADGQMASASTASAKWRMDYDAFGGRVRKQQLAPNGQVVAGADTLELGGLIARQPDGRLSFHVIIDNQVVAIISKTPTGSTWAEDVRYVHNDLLGSPSLIVSERGSVVDRPRYSPFGERRENTNLNARTTARHPERLGFAAHVPDDDWGALKVGVRSYDPKTARFLSPDPLYNAGQQLNPYAYSQNSPVNNVDPSGMNCIETSVGAPAGMSWNCGGASGAAQSPGVFSAPTVPVSTGENGFMGAVDGTRQAVIDDSTRGEGPRATGVQAATALTVGFAEGALMGVGTAYALGVVSGVCPPCALVVGGGLLVYGIYGLVNGGAATLLASGTRIVSGAGTVEDFEGMGGLVGGVATGRLGRTAFARGRADGAALSGALKGMLSPVSGCGAGGCVVPNASCFVAGTAVMTAGGQRRIEEVREGDLVLARDPVTMESGWKPVVRTSVSENREVLRLELVGADGKSDSLVVTPNHPFWGSEGAWRFASELRTGDIVLAASGWLLVRDTRGRAGGARVYNFEVADWHTYFVGDELAWVHNGGPACPVAAKGITSGSQVTEGVIRNAMKGAPLQSQQAGGVSLPKVQQYVNKYLAGEVPPAIKVDGSFIVDGNHRYIAGRVLGKEPPIQPWAGGRGPAVPWEEIKISTDW